MGDHPTSVSLFASIMMALYRREKTGEGGRVTTSLIANGAWSNACLIQAALVGATGIRHRDRWENNILANHFVSRDGRRFVLCGVQANVDWPRLCRVIRHPELEHDPRFATGEARMENGKELTAICDQEFAKFDMEEWRDRLREAHLAWGPVQTVHDVATDPQMRAAQVIVPLNDPALPGFETVSSPIHLDGEQKRTPTAAPAAGQHTEEILKQAGYSDEHIRNLISQGVAGRQKT
jgi:formyl-CoA transferase